MAAACRRPGCRREWRRATRVRAARTEAARRCGRAAARGQLALSKYPQLELYGRPAVPYRARMNEITVIGGGVAGLTAAITCAEGGASVRLLEAHQELGG